MSGGSAPKVPATPAATPPPASSATTTARAVVAAITRRRGRDSTILTQTLNEQQGKTYLGTPMS